MHGGTVPFGVASATEINRQNALRPDTVVEARMFGRVCKAIWEINTAAELATVGVVSPRTAERWLSGEIEPPPYVAAIIFGIIFPPRRKAKTDRLIKGG